MNDLRKELERQFKAFVLSEPDKKTIDEMPAEADENAQNGLIAAPADFEPEYAAAFSELSPKWQNYLSKREEKLKAERKELSAKIGLLDSLKNLDGAFQKRKTENNIHSLREWLEGLVYIDEQMHRRPVETLNAIAQVFKVKAQFTETPQTEISDRILKRLTELDLSFHSLRDYLQQSEQKSFYSQIQDFGLQKDETGHLLHPYFDAVYKQMQTLLQNGLASSIEDAYKQAVWLNADVRKELIAKQINSDAAEAQKAQKAAFSPKGKAKAPERPLTLREEIEKNMAAFLD